MKRIISALLIFIMIMPLVACGEEITLAESKSEYAQDLIKLIEGTASFKETGEMPEDYLNHFKNAVYYATDYAYKSESIQNDLKNATVDAIKTTQDYYIDYLEALMTAQVEEIYFDKSMLQSAQNKYSNMVILLRETSKNVDFLESAQAECETAEESYLEYWLDRFEETIADEDYYRACMISDCILYGLSSDDTIVCFPGKENQLEKIMAYGFCLDDDGIAKAEQCQETFAGYKDKFDEERRMRQIAQYYADEDWYNVKNYSEEYIEKYPDSENIDYVKEVYKESQAKEAERQARLDREYESSSSETESSSNNSSESKEWFTTPVDVSDKYERSILFAAAEKVVKEKSVNPNSVKFGTSNSAYIAVQDTSEGRLYTVMVEYTAKNALNGELSQKCCISFKHVSGSGENLKVSLFNYSIY